MAKVVQQVVDLGVPIVFDNGGRNSMYVTSINVEILLVRKFLLVCGILLVVEILSNVLDLITMLSVVDLKRVLCLLLVY